MFPQFRFDFLNDRLSNCLGLSARSPSILNAGIPSWISCPAPELTVRFPLADPCPLDAAVLISEGTFAFPSDASPKNLQLVTDEPHPLEEDLSAMLSHA